MLPTDYVYICVNRVSIDPVVQCCTSAKLCCGFMNILYYIAPSAMLYKSTDSQGEILQFIYRGSQILVARIGRTEQGGGHQNRLSQTSFLEKCVRKSFLTSHKCQYQ